MQLIFKPMNDSFARASHGKGIIYVDPEAWSLLSDEQKKYVLNHETGHLLEGSQSEAIADWYALKNMDKQQISRILKSTLPAQVAQRRINYLLKSNNNNTLSMDTHINRYRKIMQHGITPADESELFGKIKERRAAVKAKKAELKEKVGKGWRKEFNKQKVNVIAAVNDRFDAKKQERVNARSERTNTLFGNVIGKVGDAIKNINSAEQPEEQGTGNNSAGTPSPNAQENPKPGKENEKPNYLLYAGISGGLLLIAIVVFFIVRNRKPSME